MDETVTVFGELEAGGDLFALLPHLLADHRFHLAFPRRLRVGQAGAGEDDRFLSTLSFSRAVVVASRRSFILARASAKSLPLAVTWMNIRNRVGRVAR